MLNRKRKITTNLRSNAGNSVLGLLLIIAIVGGGLALFLPGIAGMI